MSELDNNNIPDGEENNADFDISQNTNKEETDNTAIDENMESQNNTSEENAGTDNTNYVSDISNDEDKSQLNNIPYIQQPNNPYEGHPPPYQPYYMAGNKQPNQSQHNPYQPNPNNFQPYHQNQPIISGNQPQQYQESNVHYSPANIYDASNSANINGPNQPTLQFSPVEGGKSEKVPNIGLRIFAVLLSVVVLASIFVTAGYFVGKESGTPNPDFEASNLEHKPKDSGKTEYSVEFVYSQVKNSVVQITTFSKSDVNSVSQSSGVVYSEDGYIVTNDHIYASIPSPEFLVVMNDGKEYNATYIAGDARSDLAVIKIDAKGLKPAVFGDSRELVMGEKVIAVGNPSGLSINSTVTQGIISGIDRRVITSGSNYSMKYIQTDTAINPGNSGGALVNMYGQVVGITSSKLMGEEYDRIGFAIPTTTMKKVADSLIKNGNVKDRAKLGITYTEIDAISAEINKKPRGLYVNDISVESSLSNSDIKKGDIITHINDIAILSSDVILDAIENSKPGEIITLTVKKESGNTININATLIEDKGSSSYTTSKDSNDSSKDFDFPFGE